MKKIVTLALVMALTLAFSGFAFAADGAATVVGKVEVKDKDVSIKAAEVKGADGKAQADLAGKALKVVGAKVEEVKKLAGKDVEAKGTLKGTDLDVASVAEKAPAKK